MLDDKNTAAGGCDRYGNADDGDIDLHQILFRTLAK
jgi:hypothetical protein